MTSAPCRFQGSNFLFGIEGLTSTLALSQKALATLAKLLIVYLMVPCEKRQIQISSFLHYFFIFSDGTN